MSEFRIEKVRRSIDITLANGDKMTGTVFLEPMARSHPGPQDPRELLNDDDAFFPFSIAGRLVLFAKDQLRTVTYKPDSPPTPVSPRMVEVRVTLSDGTGISGTIEVEVRSDAGRLLDFLNAFSGRFLPLTIDRSTQCLVNRRMIAGVQQR